MSEKPFDWNKLRRKPAAILGAGVSGSGAGTLLRSMDWEYATFDEQSRAFGWTEALACSVVVVSPGFAVDHPWLTLARNAGVDTFGEADFASAFWRGKIVAVTGTNGKTTLVRFLTRLLNEAGRAAFAAGNVGKSFAELVSENPGEKSTAVLELSSFQTETLRMLRPDAVIWSNLDEDHLDRHGDLASYFRAKARLIDRLGNGPFLAGISVPETSRVTGVSLSREPRVALREETEMVSLPEDSPFITFPQRENLALALAFAEEEGIPGEIFNRVLVDFRGEPHRLEQVATIGKATFWNDSKATNFSASLAACRNFVDKPFWIGGGQSKGGDLKGFARRLHDLVARAYLVGETGSAMGKALSALGLRTSVCGDLAKAVRVAFDDVREATDILFSPGFASFDSYSSYAERGKSFGGIVLNLKNPACKPNPVT